MSSCQLCGLTEEVSELDKEFVAIVRKLCEFIDGDNLETCIDCSIFIYQISVFIKRAQDFTGIENSAKIFAIETFEEAGKDAEIEQIFSDEEIEFGSHIVEDDEIEMEYQLEAQEVEPGKTEVEGTKALTALKGKKDDDEKYFTLQCHIAGCDAPEFTKMFQLTIHTREEHNCLPKVKCWCDKHVSTLRALSRHRAKHFPLNSDFRCSACRKVFRTEKGLTMHFDKYHGPNKQSFICSQCGQSFCEQKVLERHEINHDIPPELRRNFACSKCDKSFISSDARKCHIVKYHENVKAFHCEVCSKAFYHKKSLLSHQDTHLPSGTVPCDLCNKSCKTKKSMQEHRKSHFAPVQSSLLVCDICQKEFRRKTQMTQHMLVHSDVAPYSCSVCLKAFKKKVYLNTHMVIHTGEKKYRCTFCERPFADPGNCRKHKLRDHPAELAAYEAKHGKKGVSNAVYYELQTIENT